MMLNTRRFLFFFLIFAISLSTRANTDAFSLIPAPPSINAKSYILLDFHSGQILAQKNMDQRVKPASLTKMMTAYVTFYQLENGTIKLSDMATVSKDAWALTYKKDMSKMFLEPGTKVSVAELLKGLIVQSGNDAAVTLAEYISGDVNSFAKLMNEQARNLGMTHTHFVTPHGLPHPDHYSTAHDLAILASALIRDYPQYYYLFSMRNFTYNKIFQPNRNGLLRRDRFVDGLKTGHTDNAGYCLVTSADRNNMRLITVVMDAPTQQAREDETLKLLRYGYRFYSSHLVYASNSELSKRRVWYGDQEEVPVGVARPLYVAVPRGQFDKVKVSMEVDKNLEAPVRKGQPVGKVNIHLDGKLLRSEQVIALKDIPEGSTLSQLGDWFLHLFQ